MKNIIIAGGNGFIGKQFTEFLLTKKDTNVHVIDKYLSKKKLKIYINTSVIF